MASNRPILPAGLSPDSIDVVSEAAVIFERVRYTPSTDPSADPANTIALRELPAAMDPLKHKLQAARAALHTLPDIKRTIPEQLAEKAQLEEKIKMQMAVLQMFKSYGLKYAADNAKSDMDTQMSGTAAGGAEGAQEGSSSG